ncbi:MAG TPA: TonB-dependent receptor [Candidatus Acidoferrales bacterium]|nr:TonB-dependent receptor [Candidatus Acidoferrales bacterium]
MANVKASIAVAALCVLCTASALAQVQAPDLSQMDLEDLMTVQVETVSGASKFLARSTDVPASITIITADEIREFGYRTLADILQSVRGFNVVYDRNYSYVGVRGFLEPGDYNARILFLLDGHRLNDNVYDSAPVGTEFPVDVSLIDHVEIIRGASSSVYGTGALLAVINVVTKRGRDLDSLKVSGAAGTLRTYKGTATYGARFNNGVEMLISGTAYRSHGYSSLFFPEFNSPETNYGIARDVDHDRAASFFADLIYGDFNIHVVDNSRTKQVPTGSFGAVFNDPRDQTTDGRGYVDVQYNHTFGEWTFIGRASYDWQNYHGVYIYDYSGAGPPYTQNEDLSNGRWADFEMDASRRLLQRHRITFGVEYRPDFTERQINYDLSPYQLYLNEQHPERGAGVYGQDEFRLRSNLSVVGGLRLDWQSPFGSNTSPRLGLLYSPAESTHLKLMCGDAFRVPNAYEAYYASSISNTVNPALKSEEIQTLEFELQQNLNKRYTFVGSFFANRFHNLIDQNSNPAIGNLPSTNASDVVHTTGAGLEIDANWPWGIKGNFSYFVQSSRDFPLRQLVPNSSPQLAKARLLLPIVQKRLSLGVEAHYFDRTLTFSGVELGSYVLTNATILAQNLANNLDLSVSVYNLFDKYYSDPAGIELRQAAIPQDGRTAQLQLSYRFASRTH